VGSQTKTCCKQSETCEKISARINPQLFSQNWKSQEIPIFGLIFSIFIQNITIWGDFNVLSESKIKKLNLCKMCRLSSIFGYFLVFLAISNFWSEANIESRKTPDFVIFGRFYVTSSHILKIFIFVVYLESATQRHKFTSLTQNCKQREVCRFQTIYQVFYWILLNTKTSL